MSAEEVATQFVNHFYTTLNNNPSGLAPLYQGQSQLTFEGQRFDGVEAIVNKYIGLGKLSHNIPMLTKDVQMSLSSNAMIIFVSGQLKIGGENPLLFSQVFQLVATGPNQYYIHNEIFRLIYG